MSAFSAERYAALLAAIHAGGYATRGFLRGQPAEGELLLRHDVDMSLEAAVAMAEIEHAHDIQATYLLMTRSNFYNLASPAGSAAVARLVELGHHVGHHALHPFVEPTIDPGFERVMAWHNPEPAYMANPVEGWLNVMDPAFTGDFAWTYRSDSNQTWRRGDPCDELAAGRFPWLQLLIHPVLWMYGRDDIALTMAAFLAADGEARIEQLHGDNLGL